MADELKKDVIISIKTDASEAGTGISEVQNKLNDLNNTPVDKSIKNLKTQIKEATDNAFKMKQAFGENSVEFAKATKQLAELKDEADAFNRTVSAFDPGNKFNALIGIAKGASGAIQGVAGAMGLLGIESETTEKTLLKIQSAMAMTDAISQLGDMQDFYKGWILRIKEAKAATDAQSTATKGATVATKGLGTAFKTLGIGLIVSAVVYLVANFDSLKETAVKLFPALGNLGETFNKVKQVAFGVGNAVLQWIIAPIKTLVKLIQFDLDGALEEVKNGLNVVKNYEEGVTKERINQAEEAEKVKTEKLIKQLERRLQIDSAYGRDTYNLERSIIQNKLKLQKKGADEYDKLMLDLQVLDGKRYKELQDKQKAANDKADQERKAQAEKLKQEREKDLEEIEGYEFEALKELAYKNKSARDIELSNLLEAFTKKKTLYLKYGKDVSSITEAYNIQKTEIEKKYSDVINSYVDDAMDKQLSVYEQKKIEINKKIDELLKNATDSQKEKLEALRSSQLSDVDKENSLSTISIKAETNLINTETNNQILETDTPEERKQKIETISKAQIDAENAAFELKKMQLGDNQLEIERLEAEHNQKLVNIKGDATEKKKQLALAEIEVEKQKFESISGFASGLINLIGQNTVAGKALAIAQATLDTYASASTIFKQASANPATIPFPAYPYLQAGAAIVAGLARVKEIFKVKVPGKSGGGSVGGVAPTINATAPVINAQAINTNQSVQDVRVINDRDKVVKAFIVDKDLKSNEEKTNFLNKLSSI